VFGIEFHALRDFFGGLSTVMPTTASVEADFSIINWEKDDFRTSLTEMSLEGIKHSNQYAYMAQFRHQ
jgi:hypothetical protein